MVLVSRSLSDEQEMFENKLRHAASTGNTIEMANMIKSGVKTNTRDNKTRTATYIAAEKGHSDCLLMLLSHGAAYTSVCVEIAVLNGHINCLEVFHGMGIDVNTAIAALDETEIPANCAAFIDALAIRRELYPQVLQIVTDLADSITGTLLATNDAARFITDTKALETAVADELIKVGIARGGTVRLDANE